MPDKLTSIPIWTKIAGAISFLTGGAFGLGKYNAILVKKKELYKDGVPLYEKVEDAKEARINCQEAIRSELVSHGKSIESLNNFARWFLQDKGLKITEINEILGEDT